MSKPADEKLDVAPTLDASDASLAPLRPGGPREHAPGSDYADLCQVDPAHYAIAEELARGGMGRIIRARDLRLGRSVAIKELLPGHDDARFEREARITARLQHPSIVHVHEAGRWPSGEPFFAMKLVAGKPLDKHLATARDLDARLALVPNVIAVVDALAYAHSEHVIHRDLKPANVLCGDFGETVVIDWGLAKDLTATEPDVVSIGPYRRGAASGGETVAGAVMGTPAYMPPEQAEGDRVDARADVYALGAILYQVLAGVPPYEARNTEEVLARVLAAPPQPLAERVPEAPVELVAIVDKAMARDAADRFPTAKEMADELKRFQTGQLVTSHRYTAGELVRRWLRKYRAAVAVGAIAILVLAIVGVASVAKIVTESHRADTSAIDATRRADAAALELAKSALDTDPTQALRRLAELSPGAPQWRAARTIAADAMSRGVAHVLPGSRAMVMELVVSHDGTQLASLEPSRIRVWNLATSTVRDVAVGDRTMGIGFTAAGDLVHVAADGRISVWNPSTGIDRPVHAAFGELGDFGFGMVSPNGRWVALVARVTTIFDVDTGTVRPVGPYQRVVWAPDNTMVAYNRSNEGTFVRIDPVTLAARELGHGVDALVLAASSTHAWAGTYHGELIDLATNTKRVTDHQAPIVAIAVMPDGAVATTSSRFRFHPDHGELDDWTNDRAITITDGTTHDLVVLRGHGADVTALALAPDGRLVSGDLDGEIRIWDRTPIATIPHDDRTTSGVVKLDAHTIAIARRGPAFEIRDLDSGTSRRIGVIAYPFGFPAPDRNATSNRITEAGGRRFVEITDGPDDEIVEIVRAHDNRRWLTLDERHHAIVWDLDGGRMIADRIEAITISGDGSRVATVDRDRQLVAWDSKTGASKPYEASGDIGALALSSNGAKLAVADGFGHVTIYEREHASPSPLGDETYLSALAFSPDDSRLACGETRSISILDLVHGGAPQRLTGHDSAVTAIEFTGDGKQLVTTSTDNTARIWNLADGTARVLRGHTKRILGIELDGEVAVTTSTDHSARLWDLRTELGRRLPGHDDVVVFATRRPDGRIYTLDRDDRASLYTDNVPYDELGLRVWLAAATNVTPREPRSR